MKTSIVALVGALHLFTFSTAFAQSTSQRSVITAAAADARFEIVQSELALRWTFKLDKQSGVVYQLVASKDGVLSWDEMARYKHTLPDPVVAGKTNYQIFLSGIAAKNTFLINVNSGATWQLQGSDSGNSWVPIR
ncbi:hypothetical protein ACUXAV_001637 [Cupriavidus metallidurans]|jgi:hypothetical protein|uniref:hypothetical protein n=1 Tax=Cupriavidus metallidurans TaxID=119219 RepID=UPI0004932C4B|nr:hypothetical protein [Cupriavidus metallidurans]MDE4917017.1 hypothetical protein [Cupriavidus metallidurans]